MQVRRWAWTPAVLLATLSAGTWALAADPETVTEDGVVTGTIDIEFKTRTTPDTSGDYVDGSPKKDVQDNYTVNLSVAKSVEFTGKIVRQPNIYTKTLRKLVQGAALGYKLDLAVLNPKDPKQKKAVGNWIGNVHIDTSTGAYDLAAGAKEQAPLRIDVQAVGRQPAFKDMFSGRLIGKAENKDSLASYTYKRLVGKKEVSVVVKRSDPMRFEGIQLAKGPSENYARTTVIGRLDYDYDTGNWFTDGVRFKYTLDGVEYEDVVTGSIKWVEDPDRASNGKGYYDFNLRFNEEKNRTAGGESAAFEKMSDEDAFFAVDDSIPTLKGKIEYVDSFISGTDTPMTSKLTYSLNANKLTKQQIVNFVKLWLICIGPTNDE